MQKFCKCCNKKVKADEAKRTHGCTGVLMLMILVPVVTLFVGAARGAGDGIGAGVVTFFFSAILMSAKSYSCSVCGRKL